MPRPAPGTGIKVNFVKPNGETVTVEANEGESLLDLARANDMDVEGKPGWTFLCVCDHIFYPLLKSRGAKGSGLLMHRVRIFDVREKKLTHS